MAGESEQFDVVIVGAGFSGLYALHRMREVGASAVVFEAGGEVGGTWFWNCYPGARCDVESFEYSYQFSKDLEQEWEWTERYAAQPEILRYIEHVADRFGPREGIRFHTRVTAAVFDDVTERWTVRTDRGDEVTARFVVMATGGLSTTNTPDFPGLASFAGRTLHTGLWPQEDVDFTGLRVGVIGTGSSGIQVIPEIAKQAAELYVFQRTPQYSLPARNRPIEPDEQAAVKADYAGLRARSAKTVAAHGSKYPRGRQSAFEVTPEEREAEYERRWQVGGVQFLYAFADIYSDLAANDTAAEFVRRKIRETVHDPEVAAALLPDTPIGCKRICLDSGYFETYNRPNVHLVDLRRTPIDAVTPAGIRVRSADGADRSGHVEHALDVIVFATGFDAITGTLLSLDVRGRGGRTIGEAWADGPRTYLGLQVPGFPNLFTVTGPGSPSVLANMVTGIEQHVEWIADAIVHLREEGMSTIDTTEPVADAWMAHVAAVAAPTIYAQCNSWYVGANIPGKPRVFLPLLGFPAYKARCDEIAANGYEGFVLT